MFKPDIIINENGSTYICVRNWMEYSIDDSIEYGEMIIDLHKEGEYNYLLVGIEMRDPSKIEMLDLEKTEYITTQSSCYVKFYQRDIENCRYIINEKLKQDIELYWSDSENLMGIIIKRRIDLGEEMKKLTLL